MAIRSSGRGRLPTCVERKRPLVAIGVPRVARTVERAVRRSEGDYSINTVSWTGAAVDNSVRIRETLTIRASDRVFHLTTYHSQERARDRDPLSDRPLLFGALFVYNGVNHFR